MNNKLDIYTVLLGNLNKKGKKLVLKNILDHVLHEVSIVKKISYVFLVQKLIKKLDVALELKNIKIRKNTFFVPFPVKTKRKNYLIVKRILESVQEDSTSRPYFNKLFEEILNIVTKKNSKTVLKKQSLIKQSLTNASNVHYRW